MAVTIKKTVSAVQTDISSSVDWNSIQITEVLTKEISKLQFNIRRTPGKVVLAVGTQIDVYEDQGVNIGVHIFGGTVTDIQSAVLDGGIIVTDQITVTDWSFSLNSKLVAKNYSNMDPQAILQDIVANFAPSGYNTSTFVVAGGFNVASISFNYEQVTQAIEKLAKQIGWEWYVDPDKKVHFFPPSLVYPSPFNISDTNGNLEWNSLTVETDLTNMKNSVVVIGGNYNLTTTSGSGNTPDYFLSNGTQNAWLITYPYTSDTIVVLLNGVSQTIGLSQNNASPGSFQVIYNQAAQSIQFSTTPTTGLVVQVYGTASVPIIATSSNNSAIMTYGLLQDSIVDKTIKSQNEAQERADADIAKFGSPIYNIKFYTLQTGLIVGQTININSTIFNVNVNVIINRITGYGYGPAQIRYFIECTSTDNVTYTDIMLTLLTAQNTLNPTSPASTVQVFYLFQEGIKIGETLGTPTTNRAPFVWAPSGGNTGKWNFCTWS